MTKERYSWVEKVHVDVNASLWERMSFDGKPHEHSFSKTSPEIRFTSIVSFNFFLSLSFIISSFPYIISSFDIEKVATRKGVEIESGVKDLVVLKTTQSGFVGYHKDKYLLIINNKMNILI